MKKFAVELVVNILHLMIETNDLFEVDVKPKTLPFLGRPVLLKKFTYTFQVILVPHGLLKLVLVNELGAVLLQIQTELNW